MVMKGGAYDKQLLELAHPSQIEEKYGGEAADLTEYWPPKVVSNEYGVMESSLSNPEDSEAVKIDKLS
eukprot:CAMPEP_0205804564 /NCGR_PEP_ID=MMETSP0205-20121125/7527_1 /ASSEMBLY_ACC=CAM_ASM_000278 /TAXON_ID=36767 /ORGANISM="Euplotes focardii, Strain TN1" /LENGTH=67 /DNA_ID=CAMNT_0053074387 /DNA_START=563 /DNA_END=766 /DNA_ORIENTATION=-